MAASGAAVLPAWNAPCEKLLRPAHVPLGMHHHDLSQEPTLQINAGTDQLLACSAGDRGVMEGVHAMRD